VRRGSIVQMVVIGVIAGAIATAVALLIPWMPTSASKEFDRINFTYWFATVISLFVFAVVAAILVYELLNFRVKADDLSDGPPVHGHTMLEVVWTVIPTILVTAIIVVSTVVLAQNSRAGDDPLQIGVVGVQFAWKFEYEHGKSYGSLRLPLDRKVQLQITANDVIHSFWVPQFAQKQDAVPGQVYNLMITPTREGTFPVICTELCGLGHSIMRSEAIVMSQAEYDGWVESESAPPEGEVDGLAVFNENGCGACHVFTAAGSTGAVGPSLDNLSEAAAAHGGMELAEYIRESIVDPNAYAPPGYVAGTMPPFDQIPPDSLDALVQYLVENTE